VTLICVNATAPKAIAAIASTPISTPATTSGAGRDLGAPATRIL
jgi:hypothetical protein